MFKPGEARTAGSWIGTRLEVPGWTGQAETLVLPAWQWPDTLAPAASPCGDMVSGYKTGILPAIVAEPLGRGLGYCRFLWSLRDAPGVGAQDHKFQWFPLGCVWRLSGVAGATWTLARLLLYLRRHPLINGADQTINYQLEDDSNAHEQDCSGPGFGSGCFHRHG